MIQDMKLEIFEKDIENKDIMVMCTDGVLDSNVEYKNKELWIKYLLDFQHFPSIYTMKSLLLRPSLFTDDKK